MALTANAHSALRREPAWDEIIVPSLRKRLEDESHVLAKRMSAASMGSIDDPPFQSNAVYPTHYPKPSAIPRPSTQHSRTTPDSALTSRSSRSGSFTRARTFSQPFPFDPNGGGVSPPLPDPASRATSPMATPAKAATRIPVSRARAGSTSSSKHRPDTNPPRLDTTRKLNGHADHTGELYPLDEAQHSSVGSRSTMRTPRSQLSELVNEPAPFPASSLSSRGHAPAPDFDYDNHDMQVRLSTDSEERPFEHWYRGDVSRNGGVGELRVGRRQEMLDIANYGHTVRKASPRVHAHAHAHANIHTPTTQRSRSNSRGREDLYARAGGRTRGRAGSVGERTTRQSLYIDDEDELVRAADMVLDEQPLTDLESDGDDDHNHDDHDQPDDPRIRQNGVGGGGGGATSPYRSDTPNSVKSRTAPAGFRTRIPTPTPTMARQGSDSPRTPTPTQMLASVSQAPSASAAPSTSAPPASRSAASSLAQSQAQAQAQGAPSAKRKAKSPSPGPAAAGAPSGAGAPAIATTAAAAKKPRKKSPLTQTKKTNSRADGEKAKERERERERAQYPSPDGADGADGDMDMVHAIPSWTQPVEDGGNWDEVVLPVVARKKGLEGHYAQADGSPQQPKVRKRESYEPAPGTFGFDHSKYRPPRTDASPNETHMQTDEFGRRQAPISLSASLSASASEDSAPPPILPTDTTLNTSTSIFEQPLPIRSPQISAHPVEEVGVVDRSTQRSPFPFSDYPPTSTKRTEGVPVIRVTRASGDGEGKEEMGGRGEGEEGGGCCRCVIM